MPLDSGRPYLIASSQHVVEVPPDWPANVRVTGLFSWDAPTALSTPAQVTGFLADGAAPVLVTLGGSTAVDPGEFYPEAVAAVRRLGRRALVLTGPTPNPVQIGSDPSVLVVPFARSARSPRGASPPCTTAASAPPSH